jgi:UDP-N-acetylmuramate--alanine ligase
MPDQPLDAAHRPQSSFERPAGWAPPGAALVASAATERIPDPAELGRVHIIGIAGSGMSALARIMLARGFEVSGCEGKPSDAVGELRSLGAEISIGHSAEHLEGIDTVIYSTAIPAGHVERRAAAERGIAQVRRAGALGAMIAGHRTIAVAGTHGKTTTSSLLVVAAMRAGLDPSFAIGANLHEPHTNGHVGGGPDFIVEADESDGSLLLLHSDIAVLTNVEADHLENHGDLEGVFRVFEQFVDRMNDGALLVYCADDPGARRIAEHARSRHLRLRSYGRGETADVRVTEVIAGARSVEFSVAGLSPDRQSFTLNSLVGSHMALNATAALIVLDELGVPTTGTASAWRRFGGVDRRFELRGTAGGVRVYDDYAHHPTEVRVQLQAAQSLLDADARGSGRRGRLIAIFQPGTYSRTQTFAQEFGEAMAVADIAVVMDIYAVREEPLPGVTGELISDRVPLPPERVVYEPDWAATPGRIAELARDGDLVLTMGIGDVHLLCPLILAQIERRQLEQDSGR